MWVEEMRTWNGWRTSVRFGDSLFGVAFLLGVLTYCSVIHVCGFINSAVRRCDDAKDHEDGGVAGLRVERSWWRWVRALRDMVGQDSVFALRGGDVPAHIRSVPKRLEVLESP